MMRDIRLRGASLSGYFLAILLSVSGLDQRLAESCDQLAADIINVYSGSDCTSFAAAATDYDSVTQQPSSWCRGGSSCRELLSVPLEKFRTNSCSVQTSETTQAAARAILNAEMCSHNNAGFCAEQMGKLYYYADQQLVSEQQSNSFSIDCDKMQQKGDLAAMGCCVSTFATVLSDMKSAAAKTWADISEQCAVTAAEASVDVKTRCPLYVAAAATVRSSQYTLVICTLLSILAVGGIL